MDKLERAKLCRTCYFCEQGVDKAVSIDDTATTISLSPEGEATFCQTCYSCEQGVDKSVTARNRPSGGDRSAMCKNCYSCQQGVDKSVTADTINRKLVEQPQEFTWFVFPTNMCNLRCKYCYANNQPGKMDKETAEKIIYWLFVKQPVKKFLVHFFGGEPTYNWEIMEFMVEVGNQTAKTKGVEVTWSMTTNGTLINDTAKLDWIGASFRKNNPFLLSIDGRPETHDKSRVYANGKGSYKDIPVDEILRRWPNIECRPTIEPETAKDWIEDFRWLRNKGFKNIAIEPNYESEWSTEQLWDYENMLIELGKYYVYAKQEGQPIFMKWVEGIKNGLASGMPPAGSMCGIATNVAAIDHRGYLFPCQRYASYSEPDKYAIGHVETGWDELKLLETKRLLRSDVSGDILSGNNCDKCSARLFCYKGCNAANRKVMGTREISLPFYCKLTRIDVRVALSVLAELGELTLRQQGAGQRMCRMNK
jgi:uncharacterized protein